MTKQSSFPYPKFEINDLEKVARDAFSWFLAQGFDLVKSTNEIVRFSKNEIEIEAYFEQSTHEVGVGITYSGSHYSLSEILRMADPELGSRYRDLHANSLEEIALGWKKSAQLLANHGGGVLTGDKAALENLARAKKLWTFNYSMEVLANQTRQKAENAFKKRDYQTAARLYASIQNQLRPSELKRLAIAMNHLANYPST